MVIFLYVSKDNLTVIKFLTIFKPINSTIINFINVYTKLRSSLRNIHLFCKIPEIL